MLGDLTAERKANERHPQDSKFLDQPAQLGDERLETLFSQWPCSLAVPQKVVGQRRTAAEISQHCPPDVLIQAYTMDENDGRRSRYFQIPEAGVTAIGAHLDGGSRI